jgi:predicted CoA-substrate-specific enzyme activase
MFAGIDIGSATTKAVVIDGQGNIVAFAIAGRSYDYAYSGVDIFERALKQAGTLSSAVKYVVATGYGRRSVAFSDAVLPEIICHAKGTQLLVPTVRTIIDIGGQDSKVIALGEYGDIGKFAMNDKCAAGTGRFFEVLAERILNLSVEELGPLSLNCRNPCKLSSVCTVFAESEIISYLSEHRKKEDIVCGMNRAIAKRVVDMGYTGLIDYQTPIVFSGGVARNAGVVKALEQELQTEIVTLDRPQITAALGAALSAREAAKLPT